MHELLSTARQSLLDGGYTCVILDGKRSYSSKKRGVSPLLELIDKDTALEGFYAADKVVGAGAAYLYVLMGVSALWAGVVSESAKDILERYGIPLFYGESVPFIVNRTGDGVCPMERAVREATSPEDALERIKGTLNKLR